MRRLVADVISLAQVRVELFAAEAHEDAKQLAALLVQAALAVVFISFGLIFLAAFITVWYWDTARLPALATFTLVFLLGGLILGLLARRKLNHGFRFFRSSLDELERDRDQLNS